MSELRYVIDICGLEEGIRCAICENPMHTDKGCDGNCKYNEKAFKRITDLLDKRVELLPIAPEPHWIPVTERLPETTDAVLTTYIVNGDRSRRYVEESSYYSNDESWISPWDEYRIVGTRIDVIAWMPLPEPYKGATT